MNHRKHAAVVAAVLMVAALGAPASAAEDTDTSLTFSEGTAATRTTVVADPTCEAALAAAAQKGTCGASSTATVGPVSRATAGQLALDGRATAEDGTTLDSAAARTIWTRTWEQTQRGLYYVNWWEKHIGRIYFDKAGHVWSTTSTYGYKGSHTCDLGGGIGYSVSVQHCNVEQRYDLSRPAISQWDRYQVHVIFKGIPIYASHSMHSNAYDSGTITFP